MNDDQIYKNLVELKAGDKKALESIYHEYYKYLWTIAYQYLSDYDRAKDLIQDVFVDLWNRREELPALKSLKYYLRQAVINRALAVMRKENKITYVESSHLKTEGVAKSPSQKYDVKELEELIQRTIQSLPERCREIFILSRFEQLSHKEIAEKLDISTKTIENQMTKALKILREALREYGIVTLMWFLIIFYNT